MTATAGCTVLDHPLVTHKLALLRDRHTDVTTFSRLVGELAQLVAYEAMRTLPLMPVDVETPLETLHTGRLDGPAPVLVPILRAGLGMVEAVRALVPRADVGHIGLYRDHATLQPVTYYCKTPPDLAPREVFVLDPMLATGGSAVDALHTLREAGARRLHLVCLVGAPEGVAAVQAAHADVPITLAALDRGLNAQGYILPGLGDAGDRQFGTR
jgi:uracil phosphoribosyltransferase